MSIHTELKQLVGQSVKLLGDAFEQVQGKKSFHKIESLRLQMKTARGRDAAYVEKLLAGVYKKLGKCETEELRQIAKAFSLMLELINTCEAAFRTYRLRDYQIGKAVTNDPIIYVFTSHPTESRSQDFLRLTDSIEKLLLEALESGFENVSERLLYILKIAVRLSLANNRRPQVKDEMGQIFHTVLSPDILDEQIQMKKKGHTINFRTWVGGDKDGHPKVGKGTMVESLTFSRQKLLSFLLSKVKAFEDDLDLIPDGAIVKKELKDFKTYLRTLRVVRAGDGKKVAQICARIKKIQRISDKVQLHSPFVDEMEILVWLYPALVLPLEIREDSELIHAAVTNPRQPIAQMLKTLKLISQGIETKWYVRGFVISMCQESADMLAAVKITKKHLGKLSIPVIPLFENEKGLSNSIEILRGAFKGFAFLREHKAQWGGRFEIMLGYSDSSKENGVLPARLLIEQSLFKLDAFLINHKLTPVFFHGSGGSTSRGGGTIEEQLSWWPRSALDIYKVTIQGEMVQRNFNHPLIMRSQAGKIIHCRSKIKPKKPSHPEGMKNFSALIQNEYRTLVKDVSFQELTSLSTPYDYLNLLKIGSRPAKRNTKGTFSLRAIPWILCWTQTRLLLPVWWGAGSAWTRLSEKERLQVIKDYKSSPLIQSYIKNLGFTLAKVEMGVWNFHLEQSSLSSGEKTKWKRIISEEFIQSVIFFREVSGQRDFTWFRPWLGESIYFRSSMIHPLNVIQKLALERKDNVLLRETVTGIACGMLTTG